MGGAFSVGPNSLELGVRVGALLCWKIRAVRAALSISDACRGHTDTWESEGNQEIQILWGVEEYEAMAVENLCPNLSSRSGSPQPANFLLGYMKTRLYSCQVF